MQLYLKRSQRVSGVLANKMLFCLDARVQFTPGEAYSIRNYKLGSEVIYNSEKSKKYLSMSDASNLVGGAKGYAASLLTTAMAAMQLNISINSLARGHHIECKDLEELIGAEEAIRTACTNVRQFLDVAATFDGREEVVDYPGPEGAGVQTISKEDTEALAADAAKTETFSEKEWTEQVATQKKSSDATFVGASIAGLAILFILLYSFMH